ncbi:MAG: hypothetical protein FD152_3307 [Xanthobacteraceae bacterium]|nr:MAG: hypothetical protein FD152_3307 [Xanthobacteraceae bacterium]
MASARCTAGAARVDAEVMASLAGELRRMLHDEIAFRPFQTFTIAAAIVFSPACAAGPAGAAMTRHCATSAVELVAPRTGRPSTNRRIGIAKSSVGDELANRH